VSVRVRVTTPDIAVAAETAMQKAAGALFDSIFAEMQRLIGSKVWDWPGETERRGGGGTVKEVAGSPRNIVDTGALRASGSKAALGKYGVTLTWAVGYATAIHEGALLRNGGVIPPRPWTDVVMGNVQGAAPGYKAPDYEGELRELFIRYFNA
jgi:hypothetical protein